MIPLNLAQIARATGGMLDQADPLAVVTAPISFDSREVHVGGLFACLPERTTDGHDFAHQAVGDGAVTVLATRPVGVPSGGITIICSSSTWTTDQLGRPRRKRRRFLRSAA